MPHVNVDKRKAYQKEYKTRPIAKLARAKGSKKERETNPNRLLTNIRLWKDRIKTEVFTAYGNRCGCCGESNVKFLTLDHVNNDGNEHRKQLNLPIHCTHGLRRMVFHRQFNCFVGIVTAARLKITVCVHTKT